MDDISLAVTVGIACCPLFSGADPITAVTALRGKGAIAIGESTVDLSLSIVIPEIGQIGFAIAIEIAGEPLACAGIGDPAPAIGGEGGLSGNGREGAIAIGEGGVGLDIAAVIPQIHQIGLAIAIEIAGDPLVGVGVGDPAPDGTAEGGLEGGGGESPIAIGEGCVDLDGPIVIPEIG